MSIEFLTDAEHVYAINKVIKNADKIIICTAFMHPQGLNVVKEKLHSARRRGAIISVYVGLSDCFTHPEALTDMFRLLKPSGKLFLCDPMHVFHPKIYCGVKGSAYSMVIGSANLTGAGLEKNIEASVLQSGSVNSKEYLQLDKYIQDIEDANWTDEATLLKISGYKARYEIRRRADKERDRRVKKEESALKKDVIIDGARLENYLERYRTGDHNDAARGWIEREDRYAAAKRKLREMSNTRYQTKISFLEDYEVLVGKKGQDALWSSGKLYRKKNQIAKHYRRMARIIRFAVINRRGRINEIFEEMMEKAKHVPGLGPNVVTEMLNTMNPSKYPVLNANPLDSLKRLGVREFGGAQSFHGDTYTLYADVLRELADRCEFVNLTQVDHFLNYVYHQIAHKK